MMVETAKIISTDGFLYVNVRKNNIMKYINDSSLECGIYVIRNILNNNIYIGSSIMLTKRYKEHRLKLNTKKHNNKILQRAWNKYGEDNFIFEVIKTYKNITDHELRTVEGTLIRLFQAEYNICLYPETSGKPNYMRKLSEEWIKNLHKTNVYKHSDNIDTYNKVKQKNLRDASKVELIKNNEMIKFNSIKEACVWFNLSNYDHVRLERACRKHGYILNFIKRQNKTVTVFDNGKEFTFKSAGECDRYYNLWRGCTSHSICHLNGELFGKIAKYN